MEDAETTTERDLGNGAVYHRNILPRSPQIIQAVQTKPAKRPTLSWSDDVMEPNENQKISTVDTKQNQRANGSINHGFANSHRCHDGEASSCFIEIRRNSLVHAGHSTFSGGQSHPHNFYLRRHSDFIDLMKSRRLESIRKNAEVKQRGENAVALLEQFRDRDKPFRSRTEYYSVALTFVIGLGNVVRFSHLCRKYGGGAFFIPYFVMLLFEGIPLTCLEMAVGQRAGKSSLFKAWSDLVPCLAGLAVAAFAVNLICVFYYNVMVSWCLYFSVQSLRASALLWKTCPNSTDHECTKSGSENYFWYTTSLNASDDINTFSGMNMFMYIFVACSWLTTWLLSMKSLRKTSRVFVVIQITIVVLLVLFFFVAVELEGWAKGLSMLFTVKSLDSLKDIKVWMEAAGQIFFSLSISYGGIILFSSGNKWNNNFYNDALVVSITNSVTSLWASIIMFSFFGFRMNYKMKKCLSVVRGNDTGVIAAFMTSSNIEGSATAMALEAETRNCSMEFFFEQIPDGMSLAFVGMTQAFGEMTSYNHVYSCLFFFLLFLLGVGSLPAMLHVLINTCMEYKITPKRWSREIVAGVICLLLCLSNLLYVQSTGLYILELIDNSTGFPLLVLGLFECVGVSYIYGIDKFSKDLFIMTGKKLTWKWKLCWKFVSPLITLGLIIGSIINMVQEGRRTYKAWNREKGQLVTLQYPIWALFLYYFMTFIPVLCLAYYLFKACFNKSKQSNIPQIFNCGACKAIYEACHEKLGERSGTYDLTSPENLIGYGNNAIEMNGVHLDDVFENESIGNEMASNPRDSYHSNTGSVQRIEGGGLQEEHTNNIFPTS